MTERAIWQYEPELSDVAEKYLKAAALIEQLLNRVERQRELLAEAQTLFALGVGAMTDNGDKANQERCVREGGELMRGITAALTGEQNG